jgi:hypothetical protein
MAKVRREGYVFVSWKGDHDPRHVHVFRDGRFVVKWDLENGKPMKGQASPKLRRLIDDLQTEGLL